MSFETLLYATDGPVAKITHGSADQLDARRLAAGERAQREGVGAAIRERDAGFGDYSAAGTAADQIQITRLALSN